MRPARTALVVTGVVVAGYGGWLLLRLGWDNLVATLPWLVVAVLVHDGVWAPLVLLAAALAGARLTRPWVTPMMVGAVVLGTVTLAAMPVLGRFGAEPSNPSLLDRPYWPGWLGFAAVVAAGVVLGRLVAGRRERRRRGRGAVGNTPGPA